MGIKENLREIKQTIALQSASAVLVAVSKFQSQDAIIDAIQAGQKVFGENRVQEAHAKWPKLKMLYPDIKLHLIGPLQTNKVADSVKLFDLIESLDRIKLADCLLKEMHKQQRFIPCLIQVNIGCEPQKAGIMPENSDNFISYCKDKGLDIQGLMCIPPEGQNPQPYFKKLSAMAAKHNLKILSMGMSNDFTCAIECGATHVRIGTAIFGKRV